MKSGDMVKNGASLRRRKSNLSGISPKALLLRSMCFDEDLPGECLDCRNICL